LSRIIPVLKGEVIALIKMTSVVGYVAVIDLTKASDIIRARTLDAFFPLILVSVVYIILAWLTGMALKAMERRLTPKSRVL
jgi:polar amino acid transport system substrate-binding protein